MRLKVRVQNFHKFPPVLILIKSDYLSKMFAYCATIKPFHQRFAPR